MSLLPSTKAPTGTTAAAVPANADTPKRRLAERRQGARRSSGRSSDASADVRVRMAVHAALMHGLPYGLVGMLLLAMVIAALTPGVIDDTLLLGWLIGLATLSLAGLQAWWRWRHQTTPTVVSRRRQRLTIGLAGMAGALWGSVPALLYLRAAPSQQALIVPLLVGMLGAGMFTLAALPQAVAAFAATVSLGLVAALALGGGPLQLWVLLGWAVMLAVGVHSTLAHARVLRARTGMETRLDDQQQLVSLLLRDFEDNGSDTLLEIDARGCIVQASRRLADALGSSRKELDGKPWSELLEQLQTGLPELERESADQLKQRLTEGQPFRDVLLPLMLAGQVHWWSVTAKPQVDERGTTMGWRCVARDVTQSRVADKKLSWQAHYDTLTGLINRSQFRVLLEDALTGKADEREKARGAVLCLDLNNFKTINDTLGHVTGDALLAEVARRLKASVGKLDVVARLGGDEFAVLLRHQSDEADVKAAVTRIVDSLHAPCETQGANVTLRSSIGASRYPQDGRSVDEVMQCADLALYEAKAAGKGALVLFNPSLGERAQRRQLLERDLRAAIEGKQLALQFQPMVDMARWRVTGFEALLRWEHPQHGAIPPSEFVRVAEESGLILPLGEWVLTEACRQAATWPQDLNVSVNISAVQVMAQNLPAMVGNALKATRLQASRLELEITESVFLNETAVTVERLNALRKLGVRIALDDFGTGYSSLSYLHRFAFDTLKIDRAFIREVLVSREARSIVRNILALARSMRMSSVAEGVEEPAQIKLLDASGCSAVQGFYIAKPMPAKEIEAFLITWREDRKPVSRRARPGTVRPTGGAAIGAKAAAASSSGPVALPSRHVSATGQAPGAIAAAGTAAPTDARTATSATAPSASSTAAPGSTASTGPADTAAPMSSQVGANVAAKVPAKSSLTSALKTAVSAALHTSTPRAADRSERTTSSRGRKDAPTPRAGSGPAATAKEPSTSARRPSPPITDFDDPLAPLPLPEVTTLDELPDTIPMPGPDLAAPLLGEPIFPPLPELPPLPPLPALPDLPNATSAVAPTTAAPTTASRSPGAAAVSNSGGLAQASGGQSGTGQTPTTPPDGRSGAVSGSGRPSPTSASMRRAEVA
ncbi:MAG: hypothetical protein RIQ60_699 [Pseudomonadota bacterium]|jgi:diguanylate cyclase (GGDEF)-like protein/PAS domain S-box-containing protein